MHARSRLTDAQVRGVEVVAPHAPNRPMNRTITALGHRADRLGDLSEKPVARMRGQGAASVHHELQFGITEVDWRVWRRHQGSSHVVLGFRGARHGHSPFGKSKL